MPTTPSRIKACSSAERTLLYSTRAAQSPQSRECALLSLSGENICARTSKSAQALPLRDVYVHTAHLGSEHQAEVDRNWLWLPIIETEG